MIMIENKNQINKSVTSAFFRQGDIIFLLSCITDEELDKIITDKETSVEKWIEGYPLYFTPTKRIYPVPHTEIEVIYG